MDHFRGSVSRKYNTLCFHHMSNRKHRDCKHYTVACHVHSPAKEGSPDGDHHWPPIWLSNVILVRRGASDIKKTKPIRPQRAHPAAVRETCRGVGCRTTASERRGGVCQFWPNPTLCPFNLMMCGDKTGTLPGGVGARYIKTACTEKAHGHHCVKHACSAAVHRNVNCVLPLH